MEIKIVVVFFFYGFHESGTVWKDVINGCIKWYMASYPLNDMVGGCRFECLVVLIFWY